MLAAAIWQLTLGGVVTAIITLLAPSFIVQFLRQPAELAGLIFVPAGVGGLLAAASPHRDEPGLHTEHRL